MWVGRRQVIPDGQLNVSGTATLAGRLQVQRSGNEPPGNGEALTLMTFDQRVGAFSKVDGLNFGGGAIYQYELTDTQLNVIAPVLPDLRLDEVNAPLSVTWGATVLVDWTVTNQGPAIPSLFTWYDSIYLSDDDVLDSSDIYLDNESIYISAMPTASSYHHGVGIELDDNIIPGDQFLIVQANGGSNLFESDKSNNWRAVPISIAAPEVDLQVVDLQAPSTVIVDEPFEVVWTVTNNFGTATTTAQLE